MIVIEEGTDAFNTLKRMLAEPDTRKITLAVHEDASQVMLKRNEHIWSLPLPVTIQTRG